MTRWDEIQLLLTYIAVEHKIDLHNGTLFIHPHAYKELCDQLCEKSKFNKMLDSGFLMGSKFDIKEYIMSPKKETFAFYPRSGRVFMGSELYHEMKLEKIRKERNEKL